MARRTKEDAEATRNKLLDAAQEVFYKQGVGGASLAEVAQVAGLTRGAIYWHFKDKADLFDGMLQRVTLPFEQALIAKQDSALDRILAVFQMVLNSVTTDASTRHVFDIALYKVEYVGEMEAIRERRLVGLQRFMAQMEQELALAAKEQDVDLPVATKTAARGLHAVFEGVLQTWLLDETQNFDLEHEGMAAVQIYLRGLGLAAQK